MSHAGDAPRGQGAARRELPADDHSIDALPAAERALVAAAFARRAQSELDAAGAFARVSRALFALGMPREILWLASRAVTDELRHAELCRLVAERYAGAPVELGPPRDETDVRFGDADLATSRVLLALAQTAFGESIGASFLSACHDRATAPLAKAVTRELLQDEVDHARLGFAILARIDRASELGGHVQAALPILVRLSSEAWGAVVELTPERVPEGHGVIDRATIREAVRSALADLILPGFAGAGYEIPT